MKTQTLRSHRGILLRQPDDPKQEHWMSQGIRTIIYPVKDIAKAKSIFGKLAGVKPEMDQPCYV